MLNFKKSLLGKLPWPFLGAVVIVILINILIAHNHNFKSFLYRQSSANGIGWAYQYQYNLENIDPGDDNVILLGDSLMRQGIDENLLNKKTKNYIFYNLGIHAGRPLDCYMQADSVIKKDPKLIILGAASGNFYSSSSYTQLKYYFTNKFLITLRYDLDWLEIIKKQRVYFFDSILSKIFYLYKNRELEKQISRPQNLKRLINNQKTRPDKYDRGENRSPKKVDLLVKETVRKYQKEGRNRYNFTEYTPLFKDVFLKLIEKFQNHDIKVIVIEMPHRNEKDLLMPPELKRDMEDFLVKNSKELNYDYIPLTAEPIFNKTDFYDIHHLNKKGRTKLTNFIYEYLVDNQYLAN